MLTNVLCNSDEENKRPTDDNGNKQSMNEQIRELKEALVQRDKQIANLTALVNKLMADLKQNGEEKETLKKKIKDLEKELEDRQQVQSSPKD